MRDDASALRVLETQILPPLRARVTLSKWKMSLFSTHEFKARVETEFQAVLESLERLGVSDISRPGRFFVPTAIAINRSVGETCPHLAVFIYVRSEKKVIDGVVAREVIAPPARNLLNTATPFDAAVPLVVLNHRLDSIQENLKQVYMISSQEEIEEVVQLHK
jgi:hypothetical protein